MLRVGSSGVAADEPRQVSDRMEDRLRDLQEIMAVHREALGETAPPPIDARLLDRQPMDARRRLLRRLAGDIELVSGIAVAGALEAKLARVLASVDLAELAAWVGRLRLLPTHHSEWLSLIEALTVHETFFHRDRSQLDLLARFLRDLIADAAASGRCRLRLWSAGCATGEEAYTLAIVALRALREAGFADETAQGEIACRPPWQVEVLGTDISRLVLAQARTAVYPTEGLSAFRDLPSELRRYFPVLPGHPTEVRGVLPAVRQHVRFRQFNLMAEAPPERGFDVVLCRNVLMYLTEPARIAAQLRFREALRPGGYLLLGPTDVLADPASYEARWGAVAVAYALKPRR